MKAKLLGLLAIGLFVVGSAPAAAESLLEIRGGVGINGTDPDDLKDASGLDFDSFDNYNVDVFFNIPVLPIGVGIRSEWLSDDQSSGGNKTEIDVSNLSLLVDWRILDNDLFYIGPIAGIGYPTGEAKINGGTLDLENKDLTYSLAAEAGLKLGRFILAAEVGYTNMRLETENSSVSVDLSGYYGKAMVGIGLF